MTLAKDVLKEQNDLLEKAIDRMAEQARGYVGDLGRALAVCKLSEPERHVVIARKLKELGEAFVEIAEQLMD